MEKLDTTFCAKLNYECLQIVLNYYVKNNAPTKTIKEVEGYIKQLN